MNKERKQAKDHNPKGPKQLYPFTDVAPWDYPEWRPIKVLGAGGNGLASLYEYQGADVDEGLKYGTKVVVKTARVPQALRHLEQEWEIM